MYQASQNSSFVPRPLPQAGIYPSLKVGRAATLAVGHMVMQDGRPKLTQLVSLFPKDGVIYAPFEEVGIDIGILIRNGAPTLRQPGDTNYRAYPMRVAGLPLFVDQPDDPNDVESDMWVVGPGNELVIAHMMGRRGPDGRPNQGRPFQTSFADDYGASGATYGVGSAEAKRQQGRFEIWERTQREPEPRPEAFLGGNDGYRLRGAVPKGIDIARGGDDEPVLESFGGNTRSAGVRSSADVGFGDNQAVKSKAFHGTFNRDALKLPEIRLVSQRDIMDEVAERLRCDVRDITWTTAYSYNWHTHDGYLPPQRIQPHVPTRPRPPRSF